MKKSFLNTIFSIEKSSPSHDTYYILGLRINILKQEIKKQRADIAQYYQSFSSASEIPVADGNLRLIQKANLAFLKKFHALCIENDIKYWIDFGTLLGALRHNGFIPWDDDVDVSMPREDYKKFINLFKSGLFDNTEFELFFENNSRTKCLAKLKHKNSEDLFIDIFPYDFYHSTLSEDEKAELSLKIVEARKPNFIMKKRSSDNMMQYFESLTQEKILDNIKNDGSKQLPIFMGVDFPHKWKNKVFDWEEIFPLKEINFEGATLLGPNLPEKVLTRIYGDYMKIPKDSYPRHSNYLDLNEERKKFLEEISK